MKIQTFTYRSFRRSFLTFKYTHKFGRIKLIVAVGIENIDKTLVINRRNHTRNCIILLGISHK